jgi:hypothetical protein
VQPQKYEPHITVVRKEKEDMPTQDRWEAQPRHGEIVWFAYDTQLQNHGAYWYLDAWSPELMRLRVELGLASVREGFHHFHITVGNTK